MSTKSFRTIKLGLLDCNKLPELVKEILNTTNDSLKDLNENDLKQIWTLLNNFLQETSVLEETFNDNDIVNCYQFILNLTQYVINISEDAVYIYENKDFLKTIFIFQNLYSKNLKYKFKLEIVKMCLSFWKLATSYTQNDTNTTKCNDVIDFETIITQYCTPTLCYLFETIMKTTKKNDLKTMSTLLYEFCKGVSVLSFNKDILSLIVINLEKLMKNSQFLETETGKLIIGDIFTINSQLFQKYHLIVKRNLPQAKKLEAEAYGEIYFMAWINSNTSMKEIIEQQGIFDLISKAIILKRVGKSFRTYHNALLLLQSMQSHRKHLLFSKVITKLYTPLLWSHLRSEFNVVRCNAVEILARAYPLEKRGEGRENSSRYLIKQQDAFFEALEDPCPQVRISAIKGICSCLRYFWDTFEDDRLNKCFSLFARLIEESVFEVRQVMFYGFCQILEESKCYNYFKTPAFMAKLKKSLYDVNEKVRRAFIYFLLKIKKIDSIPENKNKINFAHIVNLNDIAKILACEDRQNGILLVDLIFDNFIGDKVPDRNATLTRLTTFYKINPNACRKLMIYSNKKLEFSSACKLILSLLKTVYVVLKKKEEKLKDVDKENNLPAKKRKTNNESDDSANDSHNSSSSSTASNSSEIEQAEQIKVCCILDCVSCLMILHRDTFMKETNHKQMNEIQDTCTSCLIKVLKAYKDGDAYYSAFHLSSLVPVSKLTAHVSVSSAALSTLKQLPYDMKNSEEEIDMRKVNCLVHTLCMWKRGYEILQFVTIWFDEAFKMLDLNETQYPEPKPKASRRVRFKMDIEECKPMTGLLLINSMLNNIQTQKTLIDSDVNKKNTFDLFLYLQRTKLAIEKRIASNKKLDNHLLTDELLIELFQLHLRLHVIYQHHEKNINEILQYQTSIHDWVVENLLVHNFYERNESTITFTVKVIEIANYAVLNLCLIAIVNNEFLEHYLTFCATILNGYLAPHILISTIGALVGISKHFNYLKCMDTSFVETQSFLSCICSVISVLGESKYTEERFTSIIGSPTNFRHELSILLFSIHRTSTIDFKRIFTLLIETIIQIIAIQIREIDQFDLNERLTELPYAAYQLATIILNNAMLRKYFSLNAVDIFSSNIYKTDCVLLLSAISFIYTLSFQLNQVKSVDLEPVVQLLYKTLTEHEITTPLAVNCTVSNKNTNQGISILETSDFSNEIMDFKQKGREVLIATAKQLRITLC